MLVFPVPIFKDGRKPIVTDSFGFKEARGRVHEGLDIMYPRIPEDGGAQGKIVLPFFGRRAYMPSRIPALAVDSGTVTVAARIGTGIQISVKHQDFTSQYFHLRTMKVREGDQVRRGQPLGEIWNNPIGFRLNHLHFQIRKSRRVVDPAPFLKNAVFVKNPWHRPFLVSVATGVGGAYLLWALLRG